MNSQKTKLVELDLDAPIKIDDLHYIVYIFKYNFYNHPQLIMLNPENVYRLVANQSPQDIYNELHIINHDKNQWGFCGIPIFRSYDLNKNKIVCA